MNIETLYALASSDGEPLLEEASERYPRDGEFTLGTSLRRRYSPELVAAALTQARLRQRATAKFTPADAARMFFTVDGYEQATRTPVARHRARRVAARLEGTQSHVADLCCGIGGDLIELARAGLDVTAVEADELTAEVARMNVYALGLAERARVVTADAATVDRRPYALVTCDPARRTGRGRVFDPGAYQPPWSFVLELLGGTACVKVAPGIPHERIPGTAEAEWVSDNGDLKEAALWSGDLCGSRVRRRATLLRVEGQQHRNQGTATLTDADDPGDADVLPPGRYLYEPDGAVIRAGLVTAVAPKIGGGWLLDPSIAYLSCDTNIPTPFARAYEICERLPYDVKVLRRYVRDHVIGTLTIKKRGVGVVPEDLRKALRPKGENAATLVITRLAGRSAVLVCRPLPPDDQVIMRSSPTSNAPPI